jgi:4-amino-4-deoxy-L-arabinose transferase-like glycosyltransferase
MKRSIDRQMLVCAALVTIMVVCGSILYTRLALADRSLHADEALYGYWARMVASGRDVLLISTVVDKPPLYPYVLALSFRLFGPSLAAARLPNMLVSALSIVLVYRLGTMLYDREIGLAAALLQTLSPFTILFGPTAFTDPLMVALVLGALLFALQGRSGLAGLALGLAAATKQSGLFFLPLVLGFMVVRARQGGQNSLWRVRPVARAALGFAVVLLLLLLWELPRQVEHGFLAQGWIHYGGLRETDPFDLLNELGKWAELLRYVTASPFLNTVLLLGLPALLIYALTDWTAGERPGFVARACARLEREDSQLARRYDVLLLTFAFLYLEMHLLVSFNPWDRYLLGLVPLLGLLLARAVRLLLSLVLPRRVWMARAVLALAILAALLASPARTAACAGYPIGSDHWAYQEFNQVSDYIWQNVPADAVIYHHWLGNYFLFYLFDAPQTVRWYGTPADLAAESATRDEGRPRYLVTTSGEDVDPLEAELSEQGLSLELLHRVFSPAETSVFGIYLITG